MAGIGNIPEGGQGIQGSMIVYRMDGKKHLRKRPNQINDQKSLV